MVAPRLIRRFFNGWPAKRSRNGADQATSKPLLAGRSARTSTPASTRCGTHVPSEPVRGQLAPPSASTVASGRTTDSPSAVRSRSAPSSVQPSQRWRTASSTPRSSRRRSHARSSAVARHDAGNTRPLEPTDVASPSAAAHLRRSSGVNCPDARLEVPTRVAVAIEEGVERFGMREVEPAASGEQQLAPDRRHLLEDRHPAAGGGQHLRRGEARWPAADDGDEWRGVGGHDSDQLAADALHGAPVGLMRGAG